MTSRPGPGIQESLHHRGGGPPYAPVRRATNPQHGPQDPAVDSERPPGDERASKTKPKAKPVPLDGIQTAPADAVRPAPKGKPQLFFSNADVASDFSAHALPVANLPVPPRPGSSVPGEAPQHRRTLPEAFVARHETGGGLRGRDTSVPAAVFPGGKTADLFPWAGNHPEDVLSEALVKGGISNKSQIMNETNTARPSLWSNLKNKSGISTLSNLFVAVLEKRQSCSRLTAPNNFKPPPRLTLRDSTRETWLHDLANPTVGLRRLSRTIPHGITGKVLLEQCLNKNIPIPRALWLAKCVGINEMRTHKRKGQAGTITWVRGWTSSVEQFLEGVVAAIGQHEWKPRITYALQLTTHLFKEHLLEEDHFLDWILRSLDSCVPERLFLWLLVIGIPDFWMNLISSRRRGKRLAELLLDHVEKLYSLDDDCQNTPVLPLLENIILKLVIAKPACLLLPKSWERHGSVLHNLTQRHPQAGFTRAVAYLDARNKRIIRPPHNSTPTTKDSISRLYHLLDSVDYTATIRFDELAYDCMEITSDILRLCSIVLQWASSMYRQGSHRVYLVTRLLRKWSHLGADIYDGILAYLPLLAFDPSKDSRLAFRVIAELVRSKTFSPGRYLQWLIATGSLSHHRDLSLPTAWPLRLMTELPRTGLSEHAQNLRHTLLRGTVYSADAEAHAIAAAKDTLCAQLPGLCEPINSHNFHSTLDVEVLSPTVRREISTWLRQQVAFSVEMVECVPTKDPSIEVPGTVCRISPSDFHTVRTYVEQFDDLSILADIIGIVATSLDCNVLSAACDTLHYNYKAFRAIGAFEPLFEKIAMRYAAIRTVRSPERDLLISLSDLARTVRVDSQLTQLLAYDLSRYDQKNSLAACSPASDNMMEGVAATDMEEEIERVLSSGTSMDQQMMSRVFGKIAAYLEEQLCKGSHHAENFSAWTYRLRSFEESTFDMILTSWVASLLISHQAQLLSAALPPLVASGCLSVSRFLRTVQECIRSRQSSQPGESIRIAVEGFDKILPSEHPTGPCHQQDLYRYRLEQSKFCQQREGGILEFIQDIVQLDLAATGHKDQDRLLQLFSSDRLLSVLKHFAIHDTQSVSTLIAGDNQRPTHANHTPMKALLDRLLDPVGHLGLSTKTLQRQVATVVESADQLSLPFCQLELHQIFLTSASQAENAAEGVSAALLAAIKTALEKDLPCWSDLILGLDSGITKKIQEHAEREILNASAFLCVTNSGETSGPFTDTQASIRKYLSVIDATTTGPSEEAQPSLLMSLTERLKGVAEFLSKIKDGVETRNSSTVSDLCAWLNAFLRLTVVHGPSLMLKASNQHQAALLWTLRVLSAQTSLEPFPSVVQYILDVTTLLSDSASDDVRKHLARLDLAKPAGMPSCAFAFGSIPPPDGWLSLTKPVTTPLNAQAVSTASPQSQPQSASSNQSPYQSLQQQQQQHGGSPGPLQRSMSQQHFQQQLQSQAQARSYTQYPQHAQSHKMLPQQLQRMVSNGHSGQATQLQQLQQMQQMQAYAQQRNTQVSSSQQQRAAAMASQTPATGKVGVVKQEKVEMKSVPFGLNRWEVLPESGGNPLGNETAISLTLFGARRV